MFDDILCYKEEKTEDTGRSIFEEIEDYIYKCIGESLEHRLYDPDFR